MTQYLITGIPIGPPPDNSWVMDESTRVALWINGPGATLDLTLPAALETALLDVDAIVAA